MKDYLKGVNGKLLITNAKSFLDYHGEHEEENKKYV
jgi:hypothetical protein